MPRELTPEETRELLNRKKPERIAPIPAPVAVGKAEAAGTGGAPGVAVAVVAEAAETAGAPAKKRGRKKKVAAVVHDEVPEAECRFFGDKHWNEPRFWNEQAAKHGRKRVFCASMADWLEDREDLTPHLARLLNLIRDTPHLDWLLLTKRPENWRLLVDRAFHWAQANWRLLEEQAGGRTQGTGMVYKWLWRDEAPANVWIGTTVEDQERAAVRIPALLSIPARVRFLSCEPLLGAVNLRCVGSYPQFDSLAGCNMSDCCPSGKIHWVIAGGESGHHARPMHPEWARALRDQCVAAAVPFFFKQWGEWWPCAVGTETCSIWMTPDGKRHEEGEFGYFKSQLIVRDGIRITGRILDGREWSEFPTV